MTTPLRPQQYRLSWPLTPTQVEGLDAMLETLFKRLRAVDLSVSAVQSATRGPQGIPGSPGDDGDDLFIPLHQRPNALATDFTLGSVVFAGPSNRLAQNNAKFFWDDTNSSLNVTGRGWFTGLGSFPVVITRAVDASDSHPNIVVQRYSDDKAATVIDSAGGIVTNAGIRICGNRAYMGTVGVDGSFTPVGGGFVATGISSMIDMYGDTDVVIAARTSSAGGAYNSQFLDASGNYVLSIEADGSLKWGAGANHAAEDTTLGRTAAGKLSLVGTTPMLQLGGTTASFPAIKRSSATLQIRLADDSGYAELDVATIHPAATFDFRLKQNSVDVIFSKESTAVNNTLWLEAGKIGIGVSAIPVAKFQLVDGSGNFIASNNSFGSDWIVLTNDTSLSSSNYFLAESSSTGVVLNARSGLIHSFRIANSEKMRLTATGLGIGITATAVLHLKAGTTAANTAPLKLTSGTNLTTAEAGVFEYDGTNLFFTRAGTVRENVLVAIDNVSAPTTAAGTPTTRYGGNTNYLGDPNRWLSVNILGSTYKIPLYT